MSEASVLDGRAAWLRLAVSLLIGTIGSVGMWAVVVVLPAVQAEFQAGRGAASLSYTATMIGFALGGVLMGRFADARGIRATLGCGTVFLAAGFVLASLAGSLWQFALIQGVLIGCLGTAAFFGPLMAETSLWFARSRGLAVAICASGNYLAGALWPPAVQHFVERAGWRPTYLGIGLFCAATLLPLSQLLRRPAPKPAAPVPGAAAARITVTGFSPGTLQGMLVVAGLACCVAMAMPQVHIVAYCGDLGYGVARGTEMLSIMLSLGIVSRVASGFVADRIGALPTLMLGSALQGASLALYMAFDSLTSLYLISALFGLVQGGIVPSYAILVRECYPSREAGARIGVVLMATLFGMALGGWMSGEIFDLTGSYRAAFGNGVLWNLLNGGIVLTLLLGARQAFARRAITPAMKPSLSTTAGDITNG